MKLVYDQTMPTLSSRTKRTNNKNQQKIFQNQESEPVKEEVKKLLAVVQIVATPLADYSGPKGSGGGSNR